jgi:hypothetical protein
VTAAPRPPCRHCHARPVNRCRGLCWSCYADTGIRDLYPRQQYDGRPPVYCQDCGRERRGGDGPRCSTCTWPEPERSRRHARIDEHQQRIQAVLNGREDAA